MDTLSATQAFSALSQPTRLAALRLLIQAGANGMAAGQISQGLEIRQNTMSQNLAVLVRAGLIRNARQGREIRYYADFDGVRHLIAFLLEDCCGGNAERCRPLLDEIACAC